MRRTLLLGLLAGLLTSCDAGSRAAPTEDVWVFVRYDRGDALRSFYAKVDAAVLDSSTPPRLMRFKNVFYESDGKVSVWSDQGHFTGVRMVPIERIVRLDLVDPSYPRRLLGSGT